MNAKQRRIDSRASLSIIGGIGAKVINKASGKPVMVIGKGDKPFSVRVLRGDKRKIVVKLAQLQIVC